MKKIALFASGNGSNVQNIYDYFKNSLDIQVEMVFCNNSNAGVIKRCIDQKIKYMVFDKKDLYENGNVKYMLEFYRIDFIALAGFLWLMPDDIIKRYKNKIINIHPALLPKYGGKGMYGMKVHESVIANKEEKSGITIHYVNEKYDSGSILLQVPVLIDGDTPESLAKKVHELEYKYYPKVIKDIVREIG